MRQRLPPAPQFGAFRGLEGQGQSDPQQEGLSQAQTQAWPGWWLGTQPGWPAHRALGLRPPRAPVPGPVGDRTRSLGAPAAGPAEAREHAGSAGLGARAPRTAARWRPRALVEAWLQHGAPLWLGHALVRGWGALPRPPAYPGSCSLGGEATPRSPRHLAVPAEGVTASGRKDGWQGR